MRRESEKHAGMVERSDHFMMTCALADLRTPLSGSMNPGRLPSPRPGWRVLPDPPPSRILLSSLFCPLVASVLYRSLLARAQVTTRISSSSPALLSTSVPTIFTTKANTPLPPS